MISLEKYKQYLDTQLFSLVEIDPSGKILFATDSISKVIGYSSDQVVGKDIFSFVHSEETEDFKKALRSAAIETEYVPLQYRLHHANGMWRWSESVFRQTTDGNVIVEIYDITLHRLVEGSLTDSLEWLTNVMDAFRDSVFIEENEKVVFINKAFVKMYGYDSTDEIVGRHVSEFQAPEDSRKMLEYTRTRNEGKYAPIVYQFFGLKKDGNYVLQEASVSTLHLENRKIIITVLHDLSDSTLM